jgi:hypothetical protein
MKPIIPTVLCLGACLCGCAGPGASREAASARAAPVADRVAWCQRADRVAGRLRENLAQVPTRIQGGLETAADSDVVTCLVPVIAVAGFVAALLSGAGAPGIGWSAPAPAAP